MYIQKLTLKTSRLSAQITFYRDVLNLEITHQGSDSVTLKAGKSLLTFEEAPEASPYHFAFNIPSNKEEEALAWLKSSLDVLAFEGKDLTHFVSWKAKAMYFYDPDRNIVEFIARKNLNEERTEPYCSQQLLCISEIGMPVANIEVAFQELQQIGETPVYDGSFDRFCAVGNEEGLLILIDKNKKGWYPLNDTAFSSEFQIEGSISFRFEGGKVLPLSLFE